MLHVHDFEVRALRPKS